MLERLCISVLLLLAEQGHVAFSAPAGRKTANAGGSPSVARPLTLGHRPHGPSAPRSPPRASAHMHDKHSSEHQHGISCGHSRVIEKQEASVRDFRTFLATRSSGKATSNRRRLGSRSPGPSTIRMTTEFQLSSSALPASQQQAVQAVVGTAVGVIKKFVQVMSTYATGMA